jgi:hypothetical protein
MAFPSPSRRSTIEVWQTHFANEFGIRVQLRDDRRQLGLFESHREALIYFVHVYWSPDERSVGVLATGANIFPLAFNVHTGASIPFEPLRKEVARSIAQTYRVPDGEDPVDWASSADAGIEFKKIHPEVHLSYSK